VQWDAPPEAEVVSKELVAASTRPLVLSVLAEGENYGYAIIQRVRELSGGELEWSEGMLYPVLHRLERDKLILASWKTSESGRKRRYYRLSARGARAMEVEQREWYAVHATLTQLWGAQACTA
jgi:PadR family transcriptional regulator PadR